jgi:hypothetical protein
MDKAGINYDIYDTELLAIVAALKECRHYFKEAQLQIQIYTDNTNFTYFTATKILDSRQARWAQELAGYNFKILYRPGSANRIADALARHSEYRPNKEGGIIEEDDN